MAGDAAEGRSQHDPRIRRRHEAPEVLGPVLRRGDIRYIGPRRRAARRGDPGDHPADEQPGEIGRQGHDHVVEGQPEHRDQQNRPSPEAVRDRPEPGRENQLHQRPGGGEEAADYRGVGVVRAGNPLQQAGEDRDDDAHRGDVHQDRRIDEAKGRGAALAKQSGPGVPLAHRDPHPAAWRGRSHTSARNAMQAQFILVFDRTRRRGNLVAKGTKEMRHGRQ